VELHEILSNVEIFKNLSTDELEQIAALCSPRKLHKGEDLVREGAPGKEFFIITRGSVAVILAIGSPTPRTVVHLGEGQVIGEMALIDQGLRSATVRANDEATEVQVICNEDFLSLCERNTKIGYTVMRNLAADLSFKLRHLNLITQL